MTDVTTIDMVQFDDPQNVGIDGTNLSAQQNRVYNAHKAGYSNVVIAASLPNQKGDGTGISAGTVSNALVNARKRMGEATTTHSMPSDVTQMLNGIITQNGDDITQAADTIAIAVTNIIEAVTSASLLGKDIDAPMGDIIDKMVQLHTAIGAFIDSHKGDTGNTPDAPATDTNGDSA